MKTKSLRPRDPVLVDLGLGRMAPLKQREVNFSPHCLSLT
jgi:hypothetical protein